jgi:ribosome-associated toxin RatA of RatAB toxin-antitoxin module
MSLSIERSALVMFSQQQMFELVNDVSSYPLFLPWCSSSSILEQGERYMVADIEVSKGAVRQRFVTRNEFLQEGVIAMNLVEGPFNFLRGNWAFRPLREDACKISLSLQFELKAGLARMAFATVFNHAANSMVDAFCTRARELYGQSG